MKKGRFQVKDIPDREVLECQYAWCQDRSRAFTYEVLGEKYGSQKLVLMKMEKLNNEGYIECGVSLRTAWLTDKGRAVLEP